MCGIVKLHPVRGRKRCCLARVVEQRQLQFIPARGRKLVKVTHFKSTHIITIYPRKGTETLQLRRCPRRMPLIAIYPRKGTETCGNPPKPPGNRLQFIPVRGRKLDVALVCVTLDLLQFIPARGQKSTSAIGVCQQRRCFAFSYILFYRLGTAPAGIVFVTGSALTPCGTSGFMGRISCR